MQEMETNLKKFTEKNKNLESKLQDTLNELQKKDVVLQNLQRDFKKLEYENNTLHDDINEKNKRIESNKQRHEQKFKAIGIERDNALDDHEKAQLTLKQLQGEIDILREDLEEEVKKSQLLDDKRKEFDKKYEELNTELDQEKIAKENLEREKKKIEFDKEELQHKLNDALENQGTGDNQKQTLELEELRRQLSNEKRYRQREEETRKSFDNRIQELEKENEELRKRLALSEKNAKKTEEDFDQIRVLSENYTREINSFLEKNKRSRSRNTSLSSSLSQSQLNITQN